MIYEATFTSNPSNGSAYSRTRYHGSQSHSHGNLTETHIYDVQEEVDDDNDDIPNNINPNQQHSSFKRSRSFDDGCSSLSHSSSFFSNRLLENSLYAELGSKFYSHNDGLMFASRQRQFDFSPESTPYSRIGSASGIY